MSSIIVGHRGVAGTHPENTKASIEQAAKLGLKWIEVDIQPTQDDQLVVCHDHTLERCSDGKGRVDEHTLAELRQLDFGSWKSEQFAGERILTLEELLALVEQHDLSVNLEIKVDSRHQAPHVVDLLHTELIRSNLDTDRVLLSSFSHQVVSEMALHLPRYRVGVITEQLTQADLMLIDEVKAFSCHMNYEHVNQSDLDTLSEANIQTWCYTVNDPSRFEFLSNVDAVFTDFPNKFSSIN
ncbi:glycerophosphodiester phosphodiesterase family protein [Vibrio sp. 10N.222.51.C8]|uniref:glycerophosphodiester phosphodiesterase family protein n=1 Tax=unclassified Vibrio TaxID=2614977 RepID=UPI000C8449FC|nr:MULTISPECIES: glycerophosphodiester phosphodiesterase family protein [unclassified Vibrio]PMK27194.1 glycerophosphoryl diester phosphodiesterase [Vibrio sp. 10N.261.54.C3]PMO01093.1 glycerophosphoryl diester phosphodiesterase [Vibrio sp. 10N.222.55.C12]PMO16354.1 glycerophosphoryl diester phosphodiesterase [Vibrio sp. 10N.222.54.F10]PMO17663.1 glycerophosphoryl diester phosphodiesterase [Vibrio sp. 10N.222.54.B6]TKF40950.1 glycerophosphoryl diester phosphodiesterase [Vibrio sp. F13]